jgi:hypothetical protein
MARSFFTNGLRSRCRMYERIQNSATSLHWADAAYGTGKLLGWLVGTGITPHIPVWGKSDREDGTFSRSDFTFDRERNVYVCPMDKLLKTTGNVGSDHKVGYRTLKRDCAACPLNPKTAP